MMWQLLAIAFGIATLALAMLAIWLFVDRAQLRRRFAGILDIDREIASRRHAFNIELSTRQSVFDTDIAMRRRMIDNELAKQCAELERARRSATQERADTMRKTSEMQEHYASSKVMS